jgi:deoxyribonuclease-4
LGVGKMNGLLFGTAGIPHSSRQHSTISGIERIMELGLGCMEVEFVKGVKMGRRRHGRLARRPSAPVSGYRRTLPISST